MDHTKKEIFEKCLKKVDLQIDKYTEALDSIRESRDAIDLHNDYDEEAKLLLDFERNTSYLDTARQMKQTLTEVDRDHYAETIQFGSLVETSNNFYFVCTSLGEIGMDGGSTVYAISIEAPIFKAMEGKKAGDTFTLNDKEIKILEVH
jgi:transcription elongation GreA/GreB family factor